MQILGCAPSEAAADILANRLALFIVDYRKRHGPNEKLPFRLLRVNRATLDLNELSIYREMLLPYCCIDTVTGLFRIPNYDEIVSFNPCLLMWTFPLEPVIRNLK